MNPDARRKKLLIYAGVAGAVLALVVLLKRKQAPPAEAAPGEAAGPTYASAPGGIPAAGEGQSSELRAFEQSLAAQLPEAIANGVRTGLQSNTPANTQPSLPEVIGALGGFIGAVNGNRTGEQTGGGTSNSPSQGTPPITPAPSPVATVAPPSAPAPAPSAPAPPPKAPASKPPGCPSGYTQGPHGCYRNGRCGNGCEGHFYTNGQVECQHKDAHGHCVW